MKCRYPDVFAAALLNTQPMGFYAPAQIVRDAREHGVEVREVDVNLSDWDCRLELLPFSPGRGWPGSGVQMKGALRIFPRKDAAAPHPAVARPPSPRERGEGMHPRHASMAPSYRDTHAVRLGLRQIVGVREDDMQRLVERRGAALRFHPRPLAAQRPLARHS